MTPRTDIYQTVTDKIIAAIEAGQTAEKWRMPWSGFGAVPVNGCTNKHYRGINVPMLWAFQMERGYCSGIWASYKQWQEKGAPVVFWKTFEIEPEEEDEDTETRMFAQHSTVFNADQADGFELIPQEHRHPIERHAKADAFDQATGADIRPGFHGAFYRPSGDFIGLPDADTF